jgi:hypothetical protein
VDQNNKKSNNLVLLVTYGIIILGFSITLLTQKSITREIEIIGGFLIFLSGALGICAILPWDFKFYHSKWFVFGLGSLSYTAWFLGFALKWLDGLKSINGFWQIVTTLIGLFWMWIILILLARVYVITFETNKNIFVRKFAPMIVPALLLWADVNVFIDGNCLGGILLEAFVIGSFIVALRVWKPIGALPFINS